MVITPIIAALLIGSFWTGVGATAVITQSDMLEHHRNSDVVITAEASPSDDHTAACEARYRSYNAKTDVYMSYGGEWKRCML